MFFVKEMERNNLKDKILAAREAAAVKRFHTFPHIKEQTVGQHSFNMLCMLFQLFEEPSLNLIKAVIYHDFGERWVGDVPATARWLNEDFKKSIDSLEEQVRKNYGFYVELNEEELSILKSLDALELFYWAMDESSLGNKNAAEILEKVTPVLKDFGFITHEFFRDKTFFSGDFRTPDEEGFKK